jgi:hypothetical protein
VASLTDSGSGWTTSAYAGMFVKTTGGTGLNQVLEILDNTSEVLTLASAWPVAIDTNTTFIICETREEFTYTVAATSGNLKRAETSWQHEKLFYGVASPLMVYKLGGDKTTASVAVNAQNVLDESYLTAAAKYFLRDLTSAVTIKNWFKLLNNNERVPDGAVNTYQDTALYAEMYRYGKLLVDSKTAFGE